MKTYLNKIAALVLGTFTLLAVQGCDKEQDRPIMKQNKAPELKVMAPADKVLTISKANLDTESLKVAWTPADFGVSLAVNYALKLTVGEKGTAVMNIDTKAEKTFSYAEVSKVLIEQLHLAPSNTPYTVLLQILAKPHRDNLSDQDNDIVMTSEPVSVQVVLGADLVLVPPGFNLVGSLFPNGKDWDINFRDYQLFRPDIAVDVLHYIGNFKQNAEFKIVPEENFNGWNHLIGMKDGKLTWEGGDTNIKLIKDAGYYELVFDYKAFTLTIKPYNEAGKTEYAHIGLIGTAVGGWDNDVLLQKTAYDKHIWVADDVELKEGELKIRADKKWDMN